MSENVRIFLSYAREDEAIVTEVYYKLLSEGFKPWMDKIDLLPGQFWDEEIPKVIKASVLMLIFFSNTSTQKRGYVQKELKLALETFSEIPEGQIFIIPVRLNECQIPDKFTGIHYVDLFENDAFEKIVQTIKLSLGRLGIKIYSPEIAYPKLSLRSTPKGILFAREIDEMIKKYNFFSLGRDWMGLPEDQQALYENWANPLGKGIEHFYEAKTIKGDKVVIDYTTSLTWQQLGSPETKTGYVEAQSYVGGLNSDNFAGYNDWRIPTLEEAMSLMEPRRLNHGLLYIDPIFDKTFDYIWTTDYFPGSKENWLVSFSLGNCEAYDDFIASAYVRAVRSGTK